MQGELKGVFCHLFKYLYIIWKQKLEKLFFLPGLNIDFHGLKKKNQYFTFTFSDIVSIHPFLSSFL